MSQASLFQMRWFILTDLCCVHSLASNSRAPPTSVVIQESSIYSYISDGLFTEITYKIKPCLYNVMQNMVIHCQFLIVSNYNLLVCFRGHKQAVLKWRKASAIVYHIMLTYPCTHHFYIVKLGFRGVYIIFLFLL